MNKFSVISSIDFLYIESVGLVYKNEMDVVSWKLTLALVHRVYRKEVMRWIDLAVIEYFR